MTRIRPPAAAGAFYPADPEELAGTVDRLLVEARPDERVRGPKGLIVPHAGYLYSGSVAAIAYATLRGDARRRAMLLGPSHFVRLMGTAAPTVDAWRTPLGDVPIDRELREAAVRCGATVDDEPHAVEHALEVQLPFLQRLFPRVDCLPVAVGKAPPEEVAELIDALSSAAPDSVVVVSTDLSHYEDATTARDLDGRTAGAIVARDPQAIGDDAACGIWALRGVVEWSRRRDLSIRLLDLRNSADTTGDRRMVVGYAALAVLGE